MKHRIERYIDIHYLAAAVLAGFLPALVVSYTTNFEDTYLLLYALILWGICAYLIYSLLGRVRMPVDKDLEHAIGFNKRQAQTMTGISMLLLPAAIILNKGVGASIGYFQQAGIPNNASLLMVSLALFMFCVSLPTIVDKRISPTDIASACLVIGALLIIAASMVGLFYAYNPRKIYYSMVDIAFTTAAAGIFTYIICMVRSRTV